VEFGTQTRARVIIFDNTSATKPTYNIAGNETMMQYNKALISNIVLNIVEFYDKNDGGFNHLGVYSYDSSGVHELVPIQEITDQNISSVIKDVWEKGCEAGDAVLPAGTGTPANNGQVMGGIIGMVSTGESTLLQHMGDNGIILGDIYLITGGFYTDALLPQLEDLRGKARESFIPIHVRTFGRAGNTSADRKLAANTGGTFEQSLVPNEPLSVDVEGGYQYLKVTSRDMPIAPYPSNKKIIDMDFYLHGKGGGRGNSASSSSSGRPSLTPPAPAQSYRAPYMEGGEPVQGAMRAAAQKSYLESAKFQVNSDVHRLSLLLMCASTSPNFNLALKAPGGVPVPCTRIIDIPNSPHGGIMSYRADISGIQPKSGDWEISLGNNSQDDYAVVAFIYGDAGTIDNSFFNNIGLNAAPSGIFNKAEDGGSAIVEVAASRGGELYTGITQVLTVCKPDGGVYSVLLGDDGDGADIVPGDGIYTGAIDIDMAGLYILKSRATNENGTAEKVGGPIPVATPAEGYFDIKSEMGLTVTDEPEPSSASNSTAENENAGGCDTGIFAAVALFIPISVIILNEKQSTR
jgi:hypothetical protein